ncbi:enoyl-CoA hydratase/isomerase family protein [Fontimonas sp. SYSU GA230001]|uniref:enoyl-CoA hydratase/isomerase family protein n=1 Tax=Fontimonas sp. SYSU GA230001 TaxID=3142450 RepID=UPI0032B4422C
MNGIHATLEDVCRWAAFPASAPDLSPLGPAACLLVSLDGDIDHPAPAARWLHGRPVPVIGVGKRSEVGDSCDVLAATVDEAQRLAERVARTPIAAAVLVRLLRVTERLDVESALIAESLAYSTLQEGPEYREWLSLNRAPAPAAHRDAGPAVVVTRDGDALALELNRPSNRNGMTVEMRDALVEALHLAAADDGVRRVSIRGRGKCFSTGGDLTEFGSAPDPATAHIVRTLALPGRALAAVAERAEVHVHGACVGSGIEFPAFASRIVARRTAWFQLPELQFGLIPGAGGCVGIARRIGRQRTAWMVLSGARVDAPTALDWGLVDALDA